MKKNRKLSALFSLSLSLPRSLSLFPAVSAVLIPLQQFALSLSLFLLLPPLTLAFVRSFPLRIVNGNAEIFDSRKNVCTQHRNLLAEIYHHFSPFNRSIFSIQRKSFQFSFFVLVALLKKKTEATEKKNDGNLFFNSHIKSRENWIKASPNNVFNQIETKVVLWKNAQHQ